MTNDLYVNYLIELYQCRLCARRRRLIFDRSEPLARRINLRKYWGPIAAVGTALLVGAVSWSMVRSTPVKYVTAPVTSGSITRVATATGTVNPVLTIIIGTYVSGVIQNLFCDYNTQVRAGQVCAKIDPRPYQATFDQYNAQLLRDKAALEKDRADLVRYQSLAATNAIARQQAEDQVYVVNQDEATVRLDEALVDGAKLNLAYTDIISPVDGTVVSRSVTGGQTRRCQFSDADAISYRYGPQADGGRYEQQ
jgi:HlyD family secretion protein